jgi:predicted TIM-barrel fold metal-dependent hydrolase
VTEHPGYELISADAHVIEPGDLFESRLPAGMRARAPKLEPWNGGSAWFVDDIQPVPFVASTTTGSGYRVDHRRDVEAAVAFDEVMPALYDPVERIKAQDADSVSAEVLYGYPYLWDAIKQVDDAEFRLECARAYNDWIAEFCSHDPNRLIGVGKIPTSSIDDARKELVRCIDELHLRGAAIDAWPDDSTGPADPSLDAIWEVANDAAIPVSLHYGLGESRSAPTAGIAAGMKPPMSNAALPMTASGVFDRFPNVRVVFAHGDAGWAFFWLEFFDNTYLRQRHLEFYKLERQDVFPSEYIRRHFWFTMQHDRTAVKHRRVFGTDHLLWASHFPLDASDWPDDRAQAMRVTEEVLPEDKHAILAGNAARLYRLPGYEDGLAPTPFESVERLVHI